MCWGFIASGGLFYIFLLRSIILLGGDSLGGYSVLSSFKVIVLGGDSPGGLGYCVLFPSGVIVLWDYSPGGLFCIILLRSYCAWG